MAEFPLSFGTQSHGGRFGPDTGPRHINAYIEKIIEGDPLQPIYAAEGLKSFATISGGGACRGMLETDDAIYVVSGTAIVKVDNLGGVTTIIGGIPGSAGVFMARNAASPFQIALVSDGKRYSIESDVLKTISDTDLPPPNSVTFADQRVIYSISDGRIFWSDIDDVTSIGALSFATAEGAPDGLIRAYFHRLDLWLFGTRTTEVWRSTANADDPFQRVSGGFFQNGCSAGHSVANLGDDIFWVSDKDQVVGARGYRAEVLSHNDLARDIASYEDKNTIFGFAYYSGGNGFYALTSDDWTWVFNINTGKWFERQSLNQPNWRGRLSARIGNKWIIGDPSTTSTKLHQLDIDTFDEDSNLMVMTLGRRRFMPIRTGYPLTGSIWTLLPASDSTQATRTNPTRRS